MFLFGEFFPLPQLPSLKDAHKDVLWCSLGHFVSPADAVTPLGVLGSPQAFWGHPKCSSQVLEGMDGWMLPMIPHHLY